MKSFCKKSICIFLFFTIFSIHAQETKKRIAVLPFSHDKNISKEESGFITEKIRTSLIKTGLYEVISNDQIENMMKIKGAKQSVGAGSCTSEECIIDLGNALECEKMLTGNILKAFGLFTINGKVLDVVSQHYEKAEEVTISKKEEFPLAAENLVAKISGKKIKEPDKLINRRVLILDFVNTQNREEFGYLAVSIPDAFLEPIQATKSFDLLNRNIWQKHVKKNDYKPEEAYDEDIAIKVGAKAEADVVVIGSFSLIGSQMQMVSKAIQISSQRVMVTKTKLTGVDSNMFTAISQLADEMSTEMKKTLPPLPQKVLVQERVKYIDTGKKTYSGMLVRTLIIPGLGHVFADQWRGWIYMPLWVGSIGAFAFGVMDFATKEEVYNNASNNLEKTYAEMNDAFLLRNFSFLAVVGVYAISIADILFFGKSYEQLAFHKQNTSASFYASIKPNINTTQNKINNKNLNNQGDLYVSLKYEKRF
ncbi:MAG: hypothetical protein OEZ22_09890 [Spirochaetia bacterium]|nr:hypothetical protein [Spirochaetia bacterium]